MFAPTVEPRLAPVAVVVPDARETSVETPVAAARPLIFVLDDDLAVQQGLRSLLLTYDLDVRVFGSAEEFLAAACPGMTGLLLCELDLPGMNGIALLKALRELDIRLPTIMMTKRGSVADAVGAMRAGAVDFLEKPFLQDALIRRIQETLRGHADGAASTASQAAAPRLDA